MSRREDAGPVRGLIDHLLRLEVLVFVVTGTNFGNIDRQLSAPLVGPQKRRLFISTNRGSEVYGFDTDARPVVLWRRNATPEEDRLLTESARAVREELAARTGLDIEVIADRMNRRKIDLIPLPAWADPPKSAIGTLLEAVEERLRRAGLRGGLHEAFVLAQRVAQERGPADARITSDVKHIEIGLTDKSDAIGWMMRELARKQAIPPDAILIAGDEFGPIGGFEGSDNKMVVPETSGSVVVSVGPEPGGAPAGVIHLGGGPARFRALLAGQVALHQRSRGAAHDGDAAPPPGALDLPATPTQDPRWLVVELGFTLAREHEIESLFTVANGYAGVRGSLAERSVLSAPATYIAGAYARPPHLDGMPVRATVPDWTHLRITVEGHDLSLEQGTLLEHRRTLDLRQGILWREWRHRDPAGRVTRLRFLRLASLADRHILVQAVTVTPENYSGHLRLEHPITGLVAPEGSIAPARPVAGPSASGSPPRSNGPNEEAVNRVEVVIAGSGQTVALACASRFHTDSPSPVGHTVRKDSGGFSEQWEWDAPLGSTVRLDQMVAIVTSREEARPAQAAAVRLRQAASMGVAAVLRAHIQAWASRWQTADIVVEGDEEAQRALRFAVYHLISAANPQDARASSGARGLTGEVYQGHVFWDTEIFLLPFSIFTDPPAARALLMYRYHTLSAAREKARALGYRGALFAWESADTGAEVTPPLAVLPDGNTIPVLTGQQEHHISAAIAYAVWRYWEITGDDAFLLQAGAELLLETARFWASRGQMGADGRYHIRQVIGPDEYHEGVDDNVYTNIMAQWNLERGAETARLLAARWPERWRELSQQLDLPASEARAWGPLAQAIAIGHAPDLGVFEQFDGYFGLDDLDLTDAGLQVVRASLARGGPRVRRSQVIKQADVVMLFALLPQRFPHAVQAANFRYYEPRTYHGSSLSPAIHALVAARLGDRDLAEQYFRQAAAIDLSDTMGNAAGGVHLGAQGGLWQAAVFGFAGVGFQEGTLMLDPHLPDHWRSIRFRVLVRGQQVAVQVGATPPSVEVSLETGDGLPVSLAGGHETTIRPGRRSTAVRRGATWDAWKETNP